MIPKALSHNTMQGFSRTLAELEWLVLVLVLLYFVLPLREIRDQWELVVASGLYALFIIAFRYSRLLTAENRWKLAVETWVITLFISWSAYQTGGTESPLINLYILVIIFCALTLGKTITLLEFGLIAALYFYLGHATYYQSGVLAPQLSEVMILFTPFLLVGYITTLLSADLQRATDNLAEISNTDELTGLKNRRAFNTTLDTEINKSSRYKRPFAILMIDADNLKPVNDKFGHEAGDKLIKMIARVIHESVREVDLVARYGGDEFVVLMAESTRSSAGVVAERIRQAVENTSFNEAGERIYTTVSIGIASFPSDTPNSEELLAIADKQLYTCKSMGKNVVFPFTESA
ncbi:MAG TPA: GGDEF domain-containing protein [Gammaproteobacteria bacterium]|nr:GGDEF domain-containing protein [Gammaproteobacteria bacterium]